jgi:predicted metalloprotease with PDZ domain
MKTHRKRSPVRIYSLVGLAFFFSCVGTAQATINYSISLANPEAHLFHVTMTVPDVHGGIIVQMPAWNATYQIRDFASRIRDLQATEEPAVRLTLSKLDKQTWSITGDGMIAITYAIFWDEASPFSSQLNPDHAFMNLAEILLYAPTRRSEAVMLSFGADTPLKWKLATSLEGFLWRSGSNRRMGFSVPNYDQLVDAPVEFSDFQEFTLDGVSPPVRVVVHGENWNKGELSSALTKIVRYETQLMGGAPYENYTFIFHIGPHSGAGGGMEHSNSTAINTTSTADAIATAAHEFFHLWNVKRIRPQSLEPVDYTREMWTRALWFAEGVTSTYAAYCEVRTGLWSREQFYADLGQQITALQSRPARLFQSVEESSLSAWLEKYPQYNRPEFSISYYNKGQLIGILLDVLIRDATDNRKSLDDLLRILNNNYAMKNRFYDNSAAIEGVASAISGKSFEQFFQRYVAGTDEVPFSEIFGMAGLGVQPVRTSRADLGFETSSNFEGTEVTVVTVGQGSAAERAGIRVGDSVLSINGESHFWVEDHQPGETVKIRISRAGKEREISLTLGAQSLQIFKVGELRDPTEKQRRIREGLLKGITN